LISPKKLCDADGFVYVLDAAQNRVLRISRQTGELAYASPQPKAILELLLSSLENNHGYSIEKVGRVRKAVNTGVPLSISDFAYSNGLVGVQYIAPFVEREADGSKSETTPNYSWGSVYVIFDANMSIVNLNVLPTVEVNFGKFIFNDESILATATKRTSYQMAEKGLQTDSLLVVAIISRRTGEVEYGTCRFVDSSFARHSLVGRTKVGNIPVLEDNSAVLVDTYNSTLARFEIDSGRLVFRQMLKIEEDLKASKAIGNSVSGVLDILTENNRVVSLNLISGSTVIHETALTVESETREHRAICIGRNGVTTLSLDNTKGWTLTSSRINR
jgi:hypothetical protein